MLARNFLSHEALGITEQERDALVKVLGMLERDELPHVEYCWGRGSGFNFSVAWDEQSCGTVGCIWGWAKYLQGEPIDGIFNLPTVGLSELCVPTFGYAHDDPRINGIRNDVTPAQAAAALRSYLATGEPNWRDVLATAE